jgi:hypothetical protein
MNEGKIVNAFKMDENLRFEAGRLEPEIKTIQDFSDSMCLEPENAMALAIVENYHRQAEPCVRVTEQPEMKEPCASS